MIALLKYTRKALKDEHYKLSLQSVFVAYQQKYIALHLVIIQMSQLEQG